MPHNQFLRKKLIGKLVRVHVDFIRPREGEYEERECATVRFGNQNMCVRLLALHQAVLIDCFSTAMWLNSSLRKATRVLCVISETMKTARRTTTSSWRPNKCQRMSCPFLCLSEPGSLAVQFLRVVG